MNWKYFSYTDTLEVYMKRSILFAILSLGIGVSLGIGILLYHFFYPQRYIKTESGEYINIAVAKQTSTFPVTKETQFEIEHFYVDEQRSLIEHVGNIPILIGCDKDGVEAYLNEYITNLSAQEKAQGLNSYQLVSYQDNNICLRKTYQLPDYEGYYAKSFNGTVVILQGDEKTVYEYTNISVNILPQEIQNDVKNGYYLEDDNALYNFLETYSS